MSKLSDELLQQVIDTEWEFTRRYRERYQQETEMDIYIIAFLKELQELRKKEEPFKPTPCNITLGRCKCGAGLLDKSTNYCGNCGQKIDWS